MRTSIILQVLADVKLLLEGSNLNLTLLSCSPTTPLLSLSGPLTITVAFLMPEVAARKSSQGRVTVSTTTVSPSHPRAGTTGVGGRGVGEWIPCMKEAKKGQHLPTHRCLRRPGHILSLHP